MTGREYVAHIEADMGQRLRQARLRRGQTQSHLAKVIGVHFTAVQKIEAGTRALRYGEAALLAAVLGTSIDSLRESACAQCFDSPPSGFTCNTCGAKGDDR